MRVVVVVVATTLLLGVDNSTWVAWCLSFWRKTWPNHKQSEIRLSQKKILRMTEKVMVRTQLPKECVSVDVIMMKKREESVH